MPRARAMRKPKGIEPIANAPTMQNAGASTEPFRSRLRTRSVYEQSVGCNSDRVRFTAIGQIAPQRTDANNHAQPAKNAPMKSATSSGSTLPSPLKSAAISVGRAK